MPRNSGFVVDEAALLNKYRISTLSPKYVIFSHYTYSFTFPFFLRRWEEVDHELSGSVAGSLSVGPGGNVMDEDPLGLGRRIEYVTRLHFFFQLLKLR